MKFSLASTFLLLALTTQAENCHPATATKECTALCNTKDCFVDSTGACGAGQQPKLIEKFCPRTGKRCGDGNLGFEYGCIESYECVSSSSSTCRASVLTLDLSYWYFGFSVRDRKRPLIENDHYGVFEGANVIKETLTKNAIIILPIGYPCHIQFHLNAHQNPTHLQLS